jgi:hypothetical protein
MEIEAFYYPLVPTRSSLIVAGYDKQAPHSAMQINKKPLPKASNNQQHLRMLAYVGHFFFQTFL